MTVTLTSADLLALLTLEERTALGATSIESGQRDPITAALEAGYGEITTYVSPQVLNDGTLAYFWGVLAVCCLYPRINNGGGVPERWSKERDYIRSVLKDIRDGKFGNIPIDTSLVSTNHGISWGSRTREEFPNASSSTGESRYADTVATGYTGN